MQKDTNIFYKIMSKLKKVFVYMFIFGFAINILTMFMPIYTMQVLDRVVSSASVETLLVLTIITLFAFFCIVALDMSRNAILNNISDTIEEEIAPILLKKSITIATLYGKNNTGDMLRDLTTIKTFISGHSITTILDMPWSLLYITIIFMLHPVTGYLSIFGIILMLFFAIWNEKSTQKNIKESSEQYIKNTKDIETANRNAEAMEAMGISDDIISKWSENNKKLRKIQILIGGRTSIIQSITKFCRMTLQISIIGLGTFLAIKYQKPPGGIIAGSILMGKAMGPFESAIITWKSFINARIAYKRLILSLEKIPERQQSMDLPEPNGSIAFDKAIFVPHGSNKHTIKGISFTISPGDSIGIIGPSAAGKSTIAKMIVGIWKPSAGNVMLDGCSTYRWPRHLFKKYIGYLPQDIELFNASIKQNISRMCENPDAQEVIKAAQIAGINEQILAMPDGYETIIGEGGIELSGGQKQKIGIARAFYGNVKLIVLDEPNSNLDQSGETSLINAIKYAKENKITLIMTTHKISLLSSLNKILIVKDGTIAAYDTYENIFKNTIKSHQQETQTT